MKIEIEIADEYLEYLRLKAVAYGFSVDNLIKAALIEKYPLKEARKLKAKEEPKEIKNREEDFMSQLKQNQAYKGLDVEREFGKCRQWCLTNKQSFTPKRFVNWLNRADAPMNLSLPMKSVNFPRPPILDLDPLKVDWDSNCQKAKEIWDKL